METEDKASNLIWKSYGLTCPILITLTTQIFGRQGKYIIALFFCFWCDKPPVGQDLLIHEVSRSHITMHNSR